MPRQSTEDRLQQVKRELARLEVEYEQAMSAFLFDKAKALRPQIDALAAESGSLVSVPSPAASDLTRDVTPVFANPRRGRR